MFWLFKLKLNHSFTRLLGMEGLFWVIWNTSQIFLFSQFKSYINNLQVLYLNVQTYGLLGVHHRTILPDALKCKYSWLWGRDCIVVFDFVSLFVVFGFLFGGVCSQKVTQKIVIVKLVFNANWRSRAFSKKVLFFVTLKRLKNSDF